MLKNSSVKIFTFLVSLISLFVFIGVSASASTVTESYDPSWNTDIYNTEWTKGNVSYWIHRYKTFLMWGDRTDCFIRITDENGDLIDRKSVTRLEAQYKIDGKIYHVNKEIDDDILSVGNAKFTINSSSKEGFFTLIDNYHYSYNSAQVEAKRIFKDSDKEYEECNFIWRWNHKVTEIVHLYIWYENENGDEVASSFFPNGEHPLYDEDGNLLGIYDLEGNLLSNTFLDEDGMIVEFDPTTNEHNPLLTFEDQMCGEVVGNSYDWLGSFDFVNSTNTIQKMLMIIGFILLIVLLYPLYLNISKFFYKKTKRKYRK